jgi:mRNA-degrading endonuclease RelE of RelBE toxin-antitoxin system
MTIRHLEFDAIKQEDFLNIYTSGEGKFVNLYVEQGACFNDTNFKDIDLTNASIFQLRCSSIIFDNINFHGANLGWGEINDSQLINSNLQDVYLRNSVLDKTIIKNCNLSGANLINTNLRTTTLENVNFSNAQYSTTTKFPENFSPVEEGMILVDPDNLVLDAILEIPFIRESKFDSDILENWEEAIDEIDSVEIALESLYKTLSYKKDTHSPEFIEKNHLEYDFWEISKFSSDTAVGRYLDFHSWLIGNLNAYTVGKMPGVWTIFYSKEFLKSTFKTDSELANKILEAEKQIRANPCTILGDTMKPLTGKLKGLWRYRIGDVRIVYYPNKETRNILMVTISSRGKVYSEIRSSKEYKEKLCNL